jgi:hypothetical protein
MVPVRGIVMSSYVLRHLWVQWSRIAVSKGLNRAGVSLPSPEDGNCFGIIIIIIIIIIIALWRFFPLAALLIS